MPWESTWFIFSCNPLVHSSLSNRNTVCRNDKSLTNEFRRVSHTSSDWKIHKSPQKIICSLYQQMWSIANLIAAIQVWWLYDKKPFDLGTLMGRPTQLNICPHFIFIIFINIWPSLSLSCDTHFWTRHVGIFKVAIPTEACRINQEAMVFSGEVDDCDVEYCSNTFSVSFCSGIHLFGSTNFTANGRKNIYPEGNIKRPLGTVSPWAMEVSRYRQKPPMLNSSFFVRLHSFPSTQFPVLSCPHLSASAVRVHLDGVKMGQTGGALPNNKDQSLMKEISLNWND